MARPQRVPSRRFPQARKVVPADVRTLLGRTEFKQSLRGSTDAENRRLHLDVMGRWEAQIAAARAELAGQTTHISARQVAALAGEWYRAEVALWEDDADQSQNWDLFLEHLAEQDGVSRRDTDDALELLRGKGIATDRDTLNRLAEAILHHRFRFGRLMQRRASGDWSRDTHLDRLPTDEDLQQATVSPSSRPLPFTLLLDLWGAEVRPPEKSVEKYRAAFRGLAAAIGHDDARRITVSDVRTWKETRSGAGRSVKTISDGITVCRSVMNWGVRNGLLAGPNPFSGMAPKLPKHGLGARDGYTDADAQKLLEAARNEFGWLRWLPFLLAYTGARIEEAAEARSRDVRQESGVWVLDVVPTATRRLKTAHAQRMIPIHPALEAEGFLAYVARLHDGPLFPDLAPGRYKSRGSTATKNHSRWVRGKVGITDPRKAPAHSWRHRLEDQLRIARVPIEAQDAITGHDNPRNAGAGYGRGFRGMPAEVAKELAKVPRIG